MANLRIRKVEFLKEFRLDLELTNGHRIIYDLGSKLKTARFKDLDDWNEFSAGQLINNELIWWNTNTELSLCEILSNLKGHEMC